MNNIIVNVLSQEIVELTQTCPKDLYGFEHPKGCTAICEDIKEFEICWIEWAKSSPKKWPGMIEVTSPDE